MFSWVRRSQASRQFAEKELVQHEARSRAGAVFTHRDEGGLVLVGSGVVASSSHILPPMVEGRRR